MLSKKIRCQFPDQTEGKKEKGLRGQWVGVSQDFLLVGLEEPKI